MAKAAKNTSRKTRDKSVLRLRDRSQPKLSLGDMVIFQ